MQEKTYRRLLMLQNALSTMLPHHAGLNPRAFRYDAPKWPQRVPYMSQMWPQCDPNVSPM